MMTPRERMAAVLNHCEPDRVPIDLGGTLATSITNAAYVHLRQHLSLPPEPPAIFEQTQQLPYLGEDLLVRFGLDTRAVALPPDRAFRPDRVILKLPSAHPCCRPSLRSMSLWVTACPDRW